MKDVCDDYGIISQASPHTIKKFDLIEKYVVTWAQKLLNNHYCERLIFIDCMSNSGEYRDKSGNCVWGTPVRVAKVLRDAAGQYPSKKIDLYFNDISSERISHLQSIIPFEKDNFRIHLSVGDGNEMLKRISQSLFNMSATHYLLVYDPYEANIDWGAIMPFLNKWGEVIINHMVSDSIRAIKMAKSQVAISKYERTYLTSIEQLIPYGSNRETYEERVEKIIHLLHRNKERSYFVSAFPFFNSKNAIVYNLIHCTNNIAGFRLYKETAWRTFGGKSSTKNTHGSENRYLLDFDNTGWGTKSYIDESCYYVKDIAEYLQRVFDGKNDVCLEDMWAALDSHPVFPSTGFRRQIKSELKRNYGAKEARGKMSFANRGIF